MDIFIEPEENWLERYKAQQAEIDKQLSTVTEHPDGWTESIYRYLHAQKGHPVAITTVANQLRKQCGSKTRLHREQAKRLIFKSIGRLIGERNLMRFKRKFVRLHAGVEAKLFPESTKIVFFHK